jgi:hypothetical protein
MEIGSVMMGSFGKMLLAEWTKIRIRVVARNTVITQNGCMTVFVDDKLGVGIQGIRVDLA